MIFCGVTLMYSSGYALIIPTNSGQLEAVTITNADGNWQTIALENTYISPVVVCTHNLASAASPPAVVRIMNTTATDFELRLQRPRDSDVVTPANVYCLVAEEGANELADGRLFEAHTVDSDATAGKFTSAGGDATDWNNKGENVSGDIINVYANPVVLGQVMSFNDNRFSQFWSYDCETRSNPPFQSGFADGICVGKHLGEDSGANNTRADEVLGYFVIEAGSGALPSGLDTIEYQTALGPDTIFGVQGPPGMSPHNYVLPQTYNFGVATLEAMDGVDGGFAVLYGSNPFAFNRLGLAVDEDQIGDTERAHTSEQAAFWVFKQTDYGDAPDSYLTLDASGGPQHLIQSGFSVDPQDDIFIGSSSTSETEGIPAVEGDPANGDLDDGGIVFPLTPVDFSAGDIYTVSVPYVGNARLCGWIDFDYNGQAGDGTFETDERTCIDTAACPGAGVAGVCDLVFTAPADFLHNDNQITYARFRIGPTAAEVETPSGIAFGGEVEDYEIAIDTLPVTLSSFNSSRSGSSVSVDWSTSSELFNVGFQLWGLDGVDQTWEKLHNWLVKSGSGNAVEPQSYSKTVRLPGAIRELVALGISSVDSDGTEHYYGPFDVGRSYGDLGKLKPIAWDAIRDQVDSEMAAKGYVKDRGNGYLKLASDSADTAAGTETVLELVVRESGVYRITAQDLRSAGLDVSDMPNRDIALVDHTGSAVVRYIIARGSGSGRSKTIGDTGEIYFYSPGMDEEMRLYSETRRYRLLVDRHRALDGQFQPKQGITAGLSSHYMETSRIEQDKQYLLSSTADDPWVDAVVLSYPYRTGSHAVGIPVEDDALWDLPSVLTLELGRSSGLGAVDDDGNGVVDPEHIVEGVVISHTGLQSLGTQQAVGQGSWHPRFEVPGNTPLSLTDGKALVGGIFSAGMGYAFSEVQVDAVSLSYTRPYTAKAGEGFLSFTGPDEGEAGYEVTVPETGWPVVFAFNDRGSLVRLALESQQRVSASDGSSQRVVKMARLNGSGIQGTAVDYWVSGKGGFRRVESLLAKTIPSTSGLLAQAAGSNYLLIAHPAFMTGSLEEYADFKRSEGHIVSVIDYLQIVDVFGGGQPGPTGLTNYLDVVQSTYGQLKHVLLVGGSTYDHTGKQGTGAITFIPGHYGESGYSNFTVSDVPYVANASGELFATIGRWPVRQVSELETIVGNSVAWRGRDRSDAGALLIAEHTVSGENIDFAAALDGVADGLPADYDQTRVYVDRILADNPGLSVTQALAQAKGEIIAQLNAGPDLVLYNGHASTRQLSNQNLFKAGDVARITGADPTVWLPLSCYVTFYESTHVDTLAHQLLFTGNAVGISGAMLLSGQAGNISAGRSILDSTVNQGMTLGAAVNAHKQDRDNAGLKINWALLGDPTLKF